MPWSSCTRPVCCRRRIAPSKLGYSDDEIAEIRSARAQDTTTVAGVTPLAS